MQTGEQKRRYQDVAQAIREDLAKGRYAVGDRLQPERQISEELGVSRSLVREAMIMLEIEGLVDVRKGSGTYVLRLPTDAPANTASAADIGPFELLQARQLIESNIAAFAATRVTKNDIMKMRRALDQERQELAEGAGGEDADELFHMLIAEATQNTALLEMMRNLWQQRKRSRMWATLHDRIFDDGYRKEWLEDHKAILTALQIKDPQEARKAMWQHLENVRARLLALSDVDDPSFDAYLFDQNPLALQP